MDYIIVVDKITGTKFTALEIIRDIEVLYAISEDIGEITAYSYDEFWAKFEKYIPKQETKKCTCNAYILENYGCKCGAK